MPKIHSQNEDILGKGTLTELKTTRPALKKFPQVRDFPGGPVVRTPPFSCRGRGFLLIRAARTLKPLGAAKKA